MGTVASGDVVAYLMKRLYKLRELHMMMSWVKRPIRDWDLQEDEVEITMRHVQRVITYLGGNGLATREATVKRDEVIAFLNERIDNAGNIYMRMQFLATPKRDCVAKVEELALMSRSIQHVVKYLKESK